MHASVTSNYHPPCTSVSILWSFHRWLMVVLFFWQLLAEASTVTLYYGKLRIWWSETSSVVALILHRCVAFGPYCSSAGCSSCRIFIFFSITAAIVSLEWYTFKSCSDSGDADIYLMCHCQLIVFLSASLSPHRKALQLHWTGTKKSPLFPQADFSGNYSLF